MSAAAYDLIRCALSRFVVGVVSSVVLIAPLGAQQVTTTTLKAPLAEHEEPLSQVGALLELADGRVLVADTKDRLLFLYDFAKGTAAQVSRQGAGPLEYTMPTGIFAVGDSVVVLDMLQQRMLVLDKAGTPLRTHRLIPTGDAMTNLVKIGTIFAVDVKGRFFSETRGMTLVPGKMPTMSDTVALVRWSSIGARGDTLATRVEHTEMPKMSGGPAEGIKMKLPMPAFLPRDAWGVFPDGRVAVVRAGDYHLEWVDAAGKKSAGARVPYTPAPVTESDKTRLRKVTRDAYEQGMKLGASMAASSGQKMPKISFDVEEPASWPKVKPPFGAVRTAPDGRLWIARSTLEDGEISEYDVIAPRGTLERRVRLPKNVTLIGFGKGVLYAVRKDEDDLRYLQRYRAP